MFSFYKDNFFPQKISSTDIDDTDNDADEEELRPIRTKLYVTNFPKNSTRRQLTEFFSKFGNVLECAIMWDSYAFVHYASRKEASYALKQATGRTFMGNKLFIQLSISRHRQEANWYQKEVEKLQTQLFNSLTDLDSPSPLLSSITSLANINETKLYITNLPDNCDHAELKSLFQKYGNVLECVVMWNHYAFIHYSTADEARNGLLNVHGYLFGDKNLIVQYSTSSNRPLPKCKAFSDQLIDSVQSFNSNTTDLNEKKQQNGLDFIKNFEKSNENKKAQQSPATILCYRASDLENEYGISSKQQQSSKDWIKILSASSGSSSSEEYTVSLSEIPTPDMPFTNKTKKLPTLDQIPTPPLPSTNSDLLLTRSSDSSSSSVDMSDYPISTHSHSISPYTLSTSSDDSDDLFELNSRKNEIENFNTVKKYSRSRCLLVNSILFSELKEKLCLN